MNRLDRKHDPLKIFIHANRFLFSDERLRTTNDPEVMAMISAPAIVLSAFSSELFLKCLHCIDSERVPRGHELHKLFCSLPKLRRKAIERKWDTLVATQEKRWEQQDQATGVKIPRDLKTGLIDANRSFEQMRYIYEDPMVKFYIIDLPSVLKDVVLDIYPDWARLKPAIIDNPRDLIAKSEEE